jgi:Ser/Thr protein kinase RdoA (MazF antagonist)
VDQQQIQRWTDLLTRAGHRPGAVLGAGMEGTVIDLGGDLVAKIWQRRTAEDLETLRTFYEAVAGAQLTVRTPRILQVLALDGQCVTVEPRLGGKPLWNADGGSPTPTDADVACMLDVLAALAAPAPTPHMGVLPVLEGEEPFEPGTFTRSLAGLVERRVARFRAPLLARLPGLDEVTRAVVAGLESLEPGDEGLLHGDLIPANILVDEAPPAVIDFGFLTTVGDPAFDAAVTASIYDMYGPRARQTEAVLDLAIMDRFGHPAERLALYRAAYALTTSNCFSASGSDGHFDWCVRMLERPDVRAAL